jgi:hypothetical protein
MLQGYRHCRRFIATSSAASFDSCSVDKLCGFPSGRGETVAENSAAKSMMVSPARRLGGDGGSPGLLSEDR